MTDKNVLKGIGFAVLTTLIWSGNFIVARGVNQAIPPIALSFFRWGTASLILLPFAWKYFKVEWSSIKKNAAYLFWLSLSGIALFNTFIYVGGHYTSAINLALIGTTSSPIMSIILARIFLKEKIGPFKIAGILICITGILFLLTKGKFSNLLHLEFAIGDAWVLLAALAFAIYNVLVRKRQPFLSQINFLFTSFSFGTLLLIPFFLIEMSYYPPIPWNGQLLAVILYLGLGASVISYFMWNKSIRILGAGNTALFGNLIPIFSTIEAIFILNEKFNSHHIISMLLIFAGLLIANIPLLYRSKKVG